MNTLKLRVTVFCLFLLLFEVPCYTEFEITVPRDSVTGFYGEALILPCTFPVDSSWDLRSTFILWQRGLDVVHSFYYSQDQLDRQNRHFVNRTSLFIQEMAGGNASLKLDKVTLQDAGLYTCSVSTNTGSQKKSFGVKTADMSERQGDSAHRCHRHGFILIPVLLLLLIVILLFVLFRKRTEQIKQSGCTEMGLKSETQILNGNQPNFDRDAECNVRSLNDI